MSVERSIRLRIRAKNEASAKFKKVGKDARTMGTTIGSVGKTMATVAGVGGGAYLLGNAMRSLIAEGMAFETQMASVSTMLNSKTMPLFEGMKRQVRGLAIEFGESTESLSKGLYDILSAGVEASQAMRVLRVSAMAATAGLTTTAVAADLTTTILNAYRLSADKATEVNDKMFTIVMRGKTTYAELAASMGKVVPTAALVGMSLDTLGASIDVLTKLGISTEETMTAVNAVIMTFLKPTEQGARAAEELGFTLKAATIAGGGLFEVLDKLVGLPPEKIAQIFENKRAIKAIAGWLQMYVDLKTAADDYANSVGRMATAHEKMASTTERNLERMKQGFLDFGRSMKEVVGGGVTGEMIGDVGAFLKTIILLPEYVGLMETHIRRVVWEFMEREHRRTHPGYRTSRDPYYTRLMEENEKLALERRKRYEKEFLAWQTKQQTAADEVRAKALENWLKVWQDLPRAGFKLKWVAKDLLRGAGDWFGGLRGAAGRGLEAEGQEQLRIGMQQEAAWRDREMRGIAEAQALAIRQTAQRQTLAARALTIYESERAGLARDAPALYSSYMRTGRQTRPPAEQQVEKMERLIKIAEEQQRQDEKRREQLDELIQHFEDVGIVVPGQAA